jgi:hypothetical protein
MSYDEQRRRYEQLRADQHVIDAAAARLRHRAIADGYRGRDGKWITFGFALLLDELARHLGDLDLQLHEDTLACCRRLLRERWVMRG